MLPPPHAASIEQITAELNVNLETGLSVNEIKKRRQKFGENRIRKTGGPGPFKIWIRQFKNPLIYILLSSSAAAYSLGKTTDASVVLLVVIINALIGFIQEYKAGKAIEALSSMVPEKSTVLRNNKRCEVDASDLVPGDVVLLQSGDKVPADLRLVQVKNLKVEEAALTGESLPVEKNLLLVEENAGVSDHTNMMFSGTLVTYGQGTGVVTTIGMQTELGKIADMLESTSETETPLTKSLSKLGKLLTVSISVVALLISIVGVLRGFSLIDAVLAAVTLAVAAIPEGLPAIVTITLAIGVRRMAARQAIMKKLPAVETLGSTTVICTDKTGTLTRNEMTVQKVWTPFGEYEITGVGHEPTGEVFRDGQKIQDITPDLKEIMSAGVLCNDAALISQDGKTKIQGDPTEASLLVLFQKAGGTVDELKKKNPRKDVIPFESERQFMASLHEAHDGGHIIYLKGAPEIILALTNSQSIAEEARTRVSLLAQGGMRVLAFAKKNANAEELKESDIEDGFELLGLQAMIDPPRVEAIEAIRSCHSAGITVKMITGDHRETALAIGKELGITNQFPALIGAEFAQVSDRDLPHVAGQTNIFARVAPEHKLRLVKALQSVGHVTAMTGDGVNDAPALKQADIGVAMGIMGTSVSKESADLILLDDNFATIVAAVEEGRRIYDNLIKALAFVLPTNLGLALIILIAVSFFPIIDQHIVMPILPVQILWINLIASVTLALPLAFEAKEPGIMERQPRDSSEPVLNRFILWRTILVAILMAGGAISLFTYEYTQDLGLGHGIELAQRKAQTMAVTTVIFFQSFYVLNCRSLRDSIFKIGIFTNVYIYLGIAILLLFQIGFVNLSFMNSLFLSTPITLDAWLKSAAVGATVLPVIAIEKWAISFYLRKRDHL